MVAMELKLDWKWMKIAYEALNEDDEDGQSGGGEQRLLPKVRSKSMVKVGIVKGGQDDELSGDGGLSGGEQQRL